MPPPPSSPPLPPLPDSVSFRLSEAAGDELEELVEEWLEKLRPIDAQRILRNPHVTEKVVRRLLEHRRLLSFYDVRRELALHPRTPIANALNLVKGLFWRDLVAVGQEVRLRPQVRRVADVRLADRLPGMAVGEKVSIARQASPGLLQSLRQDPSPRVIAAILENPRCSEGVLMPLVSSENTPSPVLEVVARSSRWGVRYPIRVAICRNPQTPPQLALSLLPMLKKGDLRAVAREPRLSPSVKRRARLLLGD